MGRRGVDLLSPPFAGNTIRRGDLLSCGYASADKSQIPMSNRSIRHICVFVSTHF
jgi:hypothetical protein